MPLEISKRFIKNQQHGNIMELDIPTVESKVEDESGIYTVRAEFSFGRLKGTSNIIYMANN